MAELSSLLTPVIKIVRVGIAVVTQGRSVLVGVRTGDVPLSGHAEFPGGKCEPGESHRDCAIRECREETGLAVHTRELLIAQQHAYDHATVDLEFWLCEPVETTTSPLLGNFIWQPIRELNDQQFPAANHDVINLLRNRHA